MKFYLPSAILFAGVLFICLTLSCNSDNNKKVAKNGNSIYLDPDADINDRVEDLLNRLTLEEKVHLLYGNVVDHSNFKPGKRFFSGGVERLNIPQISFLDGRQGVRTFDKEGNYPNVDPEGRLPEGMVFTTALPSTLSLSCTWDEKAVKEYGGLLGNEMLAVDRHVLFAPMINLVRTPLNGRNFENLGEDPFLSGRIAVAYIQGVQEKKVGACACLLVANDYESYRHYTSSNMDERTLREIHMLPYEMAAREGKVWTMMTANSLLNGVHCAQNEKLIKERLKDKIGYDGVALTDWRAAYETVPTAMAGTDMTTGVCAYVFGDGNLLEAVKEGKVTESMIDDKARRVIKLYIRSGVLNPELREKGAVDTREHRAIARRLGAEGMVLLKNENNLLPIDPKNTGKIVIAGPGADIVAKGHGSGDVPTQVQITPVKGMKAAFSGKSEIVQVPFLKKGEDQLHNYENIKSSSANADAVVFFATGKQYGEGGSLENMQLPFNQDLIIKNLARHNKDVIVVLMTGSAVSVEAWADQVPAILGAWFAGQATGHAIADILTGEVNPGGKLSFTMAKKLNDYPVHALREWPADLIADELPGSPPRDPDKRKVIHAFTGEYKEGVFVGHRWFDKNNIEPRYEFGFGLSYTSFQFSDLAIDKDEGSINLSCMVKNTGDRSGSEVVQVYVSYPDSEVDRPLYELKGFRKVFIDKNSQKKVDINIPLSLLTYYNTDKDNWKMESGEYGIHVGNSSRNFLLETKINLEKAQEYESQ